MELIDDLFDLCKSDARPIIAIDGPAGSGKTTLASIISSALAARIPSTVIHMDDLYNGWDTPFDEEFTNQLNSIVLAHISSKQLPVAHYNWKDAQYEAKKLIAGKQLLILEGCGASDQTIASRITVKIWLDIDPEVGLKRVLARDGEAISDEMAKWLTIQGQHFAAQCTEKNADFLLTT